MQRTWTFRTRLGREDSVERLRTRIDGNLDRFGRRPVQGALSANGGNLRKRIGYRNSFQPVLKVTLTERDGYTQLFCRTGVAWFVTAFAVFWVGGVTLFGLIGLVQWLSSGVRLDSSLLFPIMAACMLAFFCGLIAFGRYLARDEIPFLLSFVRDTLEADLVEEAS